VPDAGFDGGATTEAGTLILTDVSRAGMTGNFTLNQGATLGIPNGNNLTGSSSGVIFAGNSTLQFQSSITGLDTHTLAIYNWTGTTLWEGMDRK
jgi:hypothetical protein